MTANRSPAVRFGLITLAALAGMALTAWLGRWQLSRAAGKEALQAAIEARRQMPPLEADALLAAPALPELMHRLVHLRGVWLAQRTVFLDNRQMGQGTPGFYVVTPLRLANDAAVVLVQRGWAQRDFMRRTRLPAIDTPSGQVELTGRIAPPPSKLYALGGGDNGVIRQNLDLDAFRAETGLPLLEVSVLQTGPASEGVRRDWPEADSGAEKHYGYAFQWFSLCGLIAVLYVWFQLIAPRWRRPGASSC